MSNNSIRVFEYNGESALTLPARREAFLTLQKWLSGITEELALPDKTGRQLLIVADEIFTNISSYGYPTGEGKTTVAVSFDMLTKTLTLEFSDSGIPHNPLNAEEPDIKKPLAERDLGGLGIFIVKKLMDNVEYRRENGLNILTMTKSIPK